MQLSKKLSVILGLCALCASANGFADWGTGAAISHVPSMINPTPTTIAFDQNSNAVTGWLEGEIGVDNTTYSSSLPAGSPSWHTPVVLYTGTPPQYATFPVFYADTTGLVRGLWTNFQQDGMVFNQTFLACSEQPSLGTTWSTPVLSSSITGFPANGSGAVDELGNQFAVLAMVADSATYAPPFSIQMIVRAGDAPAWELPATLGTDTTASPPAIFGTVSQGMGLAGWRESVSGVPVLKSCRYGFNEVLISNDDVPLPLGTTDIGFLAGSIAPNGDAVLLMGLQNGTGSNYVLYTSFLPALNLSWTYPEMLSNPDNNTSANFASIKTDSEGNAVILWSEITPEGNRFMRAGRLPFGQAVTDVTDVTNPNPTASVTSDDKSAAHIAVDQFGNAVGIWQFKIDDVPTVQVASCPVGDVWTTPHTLSTTGFFPRVALSNQGKAQAVWLDSMSNYVFGSTNGHLFSLAPPSGFAGYFSSAGGTDYFLNTHWTPSEAPNVVNYQIFRDDELVASASGSTSTFILLLDCKELDGEYTLVAVGSNGNKSDPIPFTLTE